MVSHEHRCIFIHIPKTAGTSISKSLGLFQEFELDIQEHTTLRDVEPLSSVNILRCFLQNDEHFYRGKVLKSYVKQRFLGQSRIMREQFNSYFKFSFVRNPWARVYSWYNNMMDDLNRERFNVPDDLTFEDYIRSGFHKDSRTMQAHWQGSGASKHKVWGFSWYNHADPQMHWLKDWKGKVGVDFVGRFENLQKDWETVCEKLKLEDPNLGWYMKRPKPSKSYVDAYTDETRAIIARLHREDIETFGYRFGD